MTQNCVFFYHAQSMCYSATLNFQLYNNNQAEVRRNNWLTHWINLWIKLLSLGSRPTVWCFSCYLNKLLSLGSKLVLQLLVDQAVIYLVAGQCFSCYLIKLLSLGTTLTGWCFSCCLTKPLSSGSRIVLQLLVDQHIIIGQQASASAVN